MSDLLGGGSDEHPTELLSALLDGELARNELEAVRAHLATCPRCQAELDAVGRTRSAVRSLPSLALPEVVVSRVRFLSMAGLGRRRRRAAAGLAGLAAAAAGVFLVVAPGDQPVNPQVAHLVEVHATSGGAGDTLSQLAPAAVPVSFEAP